MPRQFRGHHHFILLLNVSNVFEALISSPILLKILVPKFAIDSLPKRTVRIFTLRK